MDERFVRNEMLWGPEGQRRLAQAHVILLGLGGVGSYTAECLARSGIGELTIVDSDTVSVSNINRQLEALTSTVGQSKAEAVAARLRDINPNAVVHPIQGLYDAAHREEFFPDGCRYDYIVDAIDLVSCKLDLAETARRLEIPLIMALGTGNKLDPTALQITDISKTYGCPLARVMRKELRNRGIHHQLVVFSPECARQQSLGPCGRGTASGQRRSTGDSSERWVCLMLTGTLVNTLAVLAGSVVGLLLTWLAGRFSQVLPAGSVRLGERLQTIIMQGVALCVLYLGVSGSLQGQNSLIAILSMVLGAILGELLDLDRRMQALGEWVQKKTERLALGGGKTSISEGFVTASLLFCVGAMAIVGALQDGLTGDHSTLFAKSLLDGISSVVFAASLGVGVVFSAAAILIYQGLIAVAASFLSPLLGDAVIAEMTCVGSLLIVALSLNMLNLTKIKVMNLVPAIFLPILLCRVM